MSTVLARGVLTDAVPDLDTARAASAAEAEAWATVDIASTPEEREALCAAALEKCEHAGRAWQTREDDARSRMCAAAAAAGLSPDLTRTLESAVRHLIRREESGCGPSEWHVVLTRDGRHLALPPFAPVDPEHARVAAVCADGTITLS